MKLLKNFNYLKYNLLIIFCVLIIISSNLISCTKELPKTEPLQFSNLKRLIISSASFRVKTSFLPLLKDPYIGHSLPDPLLDATRRWAEHRFTVVGNSGSVLLTILNATAMQENLNKRSGIEGLFYEDQELKIKMKVEILIEIFNENKKVIATIKAESNRERTLKEGLSINEKDTHLLDMERRLFIDLDHVILQEINAKIPNYFRNL